MTDLVIRSVRAEDEAAVWNMLQPVFAAGETYALDRDISREDALAFWTKGKHVFVVDGGDGNLVGTYFLGRNQKGGGSHVCNCGYITAEAAQGQGIARLMLDHSLEFAKECGFQAMQYNFVISTNRRAVETWKQNGFDVVGRLPEAFDHPRDGLVDALIMYRKL